jgi:hypothetical protein
MDYLIDFIFIPISNSNQILNENYKFIKLTLTEETNYGLYFNTHYLSNDIEELERLSLEKKKQFAIRYILISNETEIIGDYGLAGLLNLKKIVIPNSVKIINDRAFSLCKSLKRVIIPFFIKGMGHSIFEETKISQIELPPSIHTLHYQYQYCQSLIYPVIPETIKHLRGDVFNLCYGIRLVTLPRSIETMSINSLIHCYNSNTIILMPREFLNKFPFIAKNHKGAIELY